MVQKVFMFADHKDLILYTQACLAAVGNGCVIPLFAVIFGDLVNAMGADNIQKEVNRKVLQLVYLSIGALCLGCIEVSMSASSTKRQVNRGKSEIFSQILEKPMSWHQIRRSSDVIMTLMGKELPTIQLALGETVEGIRHAVTAVAGLIVAFSRGAKLTLFVLTILPVLFLINFIIKRLSKRLDVGLQAHRRESNFAVKETFSNIKTVASFNLETTFCDRYGSILSRLATFSLADSFLSGLEVSIIAGIFSFAYALTIYNGAKYVAEGSYTGGQVIAVLFSAIMAGFSASQAIPCFNCTWNGHIAGQQISVALSPGSESKNLVSEPGKCIKDLNMDIEFIDVHFAYPTRPDRTILNSFNMILPSNTSTAIVGPSGSGKSTIINLLLKYYSPDGGGIFIDGVNLSEISAKEWRSNIAYIPQEVCIFSGSIVDNIRISKPSSSFNEVVSACKKARCHDFIQKLPNGYDTFLDSNNSLSGGQRQRIGIARAFLRDSRILLLDEATAALDNRSEQEINETLQQMFACEKTVVSIAHKLSTVMSMNSIAVAKDGRIVEQGSHSDLMATGKVYRSLVKTMTAADASFNEISPEVQNAPAKEKPVLRDSVLRKRSVRLSIIPEKIRKKLKIGQEEDGEEETKWTDIGALLRTAHGIDFSSLKSKILLALSLFSSCIMGLQYPAYSLALSGSVDAFLRPTPELIKDGGSKWALVYTGIGFGFIVFGALQTYSWTYVGEHLSNSIKQTIFQRAVSRPIDWHEKTDNDTSSMLTLLSNDSDNIKQALTTQVGALIQTFVTLTASLVIAFYSSATLTLVILSIFPLLLLAQLVQAWAKEGGYHQSGQDALNRFSFEATKNIRDIHTFSIEGILSNRFEYLIQRQNNQNIWIPGCAFGLSQFMLYNTISLAFWFGTRQVASFSISVEDLMRAFCSLFFATFSLAQTNSQFGVIGKAKESARKVQKVLQCAPGAVQGAKLPRYNGEISFDDVTFAYPCRPERLVFKHLNLHIKAHSSCALVGESGHGKSSCFGLLQSFYRPAEGVVRIDGIDINKLDTAWIRHITSFVTQDPVIFCGQSIRENIRYGDQNADEQRVIEAAKAAHCHQFIQTFPDGYDTLIGDTHVQLSGGQKQRIAIARAMLKNSGILLMDEPTAALDSISEKQILNSLKSFMQNKTCIVVAHRLGTIKDFDLIAAIYRGRVLEKGTHSELVQLGGYYNYLIQTQKQ